MKQLSRGKLKENEEWVEGFYVHYDDIKDNHKDDCDYIVGRHNGEYFPYYLVRPETIGKCSYFTDKNTKPIFEGDIVRFSDESECYYPEEHIELLGQIVFEHGTFGIGSIKEMPISLDCWCENTHFVSLWELYWNFDSTNDELPMLEVIGNIHDNPELLK